MCCAIWQTDRIWSDDRRVKTKGPASIAGAFFMANSLQCDWCFTDDWDSFYFMTSVTVKLSGVLVACALALAAFQVKAEDNLTVVELFTSQGCNSCPPADAYLSELAKRDNILALTWAVDYWNYLGWQDTFSQPAHTKRQKDYNHALGKLGVYTPQMVLNGVAQEVGSRQDRVEDWIRKQQEKHPARIPVSISIDGNNVVVTAGAREARRPATVWLIEYQQEADVNIQSGELQGKTLHYSNVVLNSHKLGVWNGEAATYTLPFDAITDKATNGCAVLVQYDDTGPIIGAARVEIEY